MLFTVKQAREYAGITQKEMAQKLNIHRCTYSKIEKNPGLATINQAKAISCITAIPIDNIFFEK